MIERNALLRGRILQEIENIARVVGRVEKAMEKARSGESDEVLLMYIRSSLTRSSWSA
jgi:hypothetical protein